jgi:hypothetical protein
MRNLLKQTVEFLQSKGKTPADVRWVGVRDPDYLKFIRPIPKPMPHGSWDDFERFADFEYGYGGVGINKGLVIVGDDWWLERGECDGVEWWDFKTLPQKPPETTPLRDTDLKDG